MRKSHKQKVIDRKFKRGLNKLAREAGARLAEHIDKMILAGMLGPKDISS